MAASDQDQILNVLLIAQVEASALQHPIASVLSAMVRALGPAYKAGGSRAVSASVNGKSFSFQVDPRLNSSDLLTAIRGAMALSNGLTDAQITALLTTPASPWGRVGFGGCQPDYY